MAAGTKRNLNTQSPKKTTKKTKPTDPTLNEPTAEDFNVFYDLFAPAGATLKFSNVGQKLTTKACALFIFAEHGTFDTTKASNLGLNGSPDIIKLWAKHTHKNKTADKATEELKKLYTKYFHGLFNICDKILVSFDILLEWREQMKRGVPITVAIESKLAILLKKSTQIIFLWHAKIYHSSHHDKMWARTTKVIDRLHIKNHKDPKCKTIYNPEGKVPEDFNTMAVEQTFVWARIEVCVKFCPRCNLPYRYQEFNDGVHNFNDFWIFSLGFMDLIRQFFKYFVFCVISASELDVPEDNNDEVDADLFWNQVCLAMVYRGFLHTGLSDVHNPFVVKPSYKFWAPWIGRHTRASKTILNTEYKKCHHDKDVAESGTWHQMNVEDVVEILEQGSVKVLKELCQKLLIADTAKQSKIDLIMKLKVQLGIPSEFVKVFSKFWGGSAMGEIQSEQAYIDNDGDPKDTIPCNKKTGVVYQIPCGDCEAVYIGETGRSLGTRKKEHMASVRLAKTQASALAEHATKEGHDIAWDDTKIIATESSWVRRKWTEAWKITKNKNAFIQ
ncbi:hypothetical protein QZH41_003002 [Actinostola sp. cb2023]|nr:hypothetical protein QZH41_003002 [Actinostola sp. cb2023]